MKDLTRNVLLGYGGFCVLNWAAAYYSARSGSPFLFGSAQLLQLNENLGRVNLIRWLIDPIQSAERHMHMQSSVAAAPRIAIPTPTGATITVQPSGTTTTFDQP